MPRIPKVFSMDGQGGVDGQDDLSTLSLPIAAHRCPTSRTSSLRRRCKDQGPLPSPALRILGGADHAMGAC